MRPIFAATLALIIALVAGCAAQPQAPEEIRQGVIQQITPVSIPTDHHEGLGAIIGGIAGAGLGSLMGGGTGRDVAIAVGAIGGALAGGEVAKQHAQPQQGQQLVVRLSSGVLVVVTQPVNPVLATGMPVYIQGSGQTARVTPR